MDNVIKQCFNGKAFVTIILLGAFQTGSGVVPGQPNKPTINGIGPRSVNISIVGHDANVTAYSFLIAPKHADESTRTLCTDGGSTEISDLSPNTIYSLTASGVNDKGVGPASEPTEVHTLTVPSLITSDSLPTSVFVFIDDNPRISQWIVEYRKKGEDTSSNVTTTKKGKQFALLLEGLVPNTEYEVRGIQGNTTAIEYPEYGEWVTFKTIPLSIFGVVTLENTRYNATTHKDRSSAEYLDIFNEIQNASSGVEGFLNLIIIEIENGAVNGCAVVHYEIQVMDESLPARGNFTLTSPGFQNSYINNGAKSSGQPDVFIASDGTYYFTYSLSDCPDVTVYDRHIRFTASNGNTSRFTVRQPEGGPLCSEYGFYSTDDILFDDLKSNEIYGIDFETFEKTVFNVSGGQALYNRWYSHQIFSTNQLLGSIFSNTDLTSSDIFNITYAIESGPNGTFVIVHLPNIPRATGINISDKDSNSNVASLSKSEIDGSSSLQIAIQGLSSNTTYNLIVTVQVQKYGGVLSSAQKDFSLSTVSSNATRHRLRTQNPQNIFVGCTPVQGTQEPQNATSTTMTHPDTSTSASINATGHMSQNLTAGKPMSPSQGSQTPQATTSPTTTQTQTSALMNTTEQNFTAGTPVPPFQGTQTTPRAITSPTTMQTQTSEATDANPTQAPVPDNCATDAEYKQYLEAWNGAFQDWNQAMEEWQNGYC